ncbi:hypothetical protein B0H21DRAFT_822298 [Amylocystis lapponica]|nr:hypothetical protein B0H21DRAFT_822298 [Amylocystis lapponica]
MDLESLSVEVLTLILDKLPVRDLLVCKQVSRFLSQIIDDSERLQYSIDLAIAGMVDGLPGGLCVADRRSMLKEYQKAWRDAEFPLQPVMSITNPQYDSIGLSGISGNVFLQQAPTGLEFVRLPSRIRGINAERWRIDSATLGFNPHAFAMDPSQDLLVLLDEDNDEDARIHILSMLSGAPHPLAASSILSEVERYIGFSELRVCGDCVGWLVCRETGDRTGSSLQVWNWKTGILIWEMRTDPGEPFIEEPFLLSFHFYNDSLVIVAYRRRLAVYSVDMHATSLTEATCESYVLSLDLFPMHEDTEVLSVGLYPEACFSGAEVDPQAPFEYSAVHSLFVVIVEMATVAVRGDFMMHVPARTIRDCLIQVRADPSARKVPWHEWGPHGTRTMQVPGEPDWCCFDVQGSRAMHALCSDVADVICVRVLEFGPMVRRHVLNSRGGVDLLEDVEGRAVYMSMPTGHRWGEDFHTEGFITWLPCRLSWWNVSLPSQDLPLNVMLYDDGIVIQQSENEVQVYAL